MRIPRLVGRQALASCAAAALLAGCAAPVASPGPAGAVSAPEKVEPPAKVTVDGDEIALIHALAVGWGSRRYVVHLFNHDQVTCEQLLAPSRQVARDEVDVRVAGSAEGGFMDGLGIKEFARLGVEVKLVEEPRQVGDMVGLEVPKPEELVPNVGALKGKTVVVSGLFRGRYCGERG